MKQILIINLIKEVSRQLVVSVGLLISIIVPGQLGAQTDTTQTADSSAAAMEESALITPAIEFLSTQKEDKTIDLKAKLSAKVKGSFFKLSLLKVTFLQVTDSSEKELGFVISDRNGVALFHAKAESLVINKDGKLHFKAVFAGNKGMEPATEELTIRRARLEITPVKEDSLLTVQVKLIDIGTGDEVPVAETVVGIYVKRMFNPLKLGEGTTDVNGEATIEIPNKLPGDSKGIITLLAKLDESELYGNLESSVSQKWGIPVSDQFQELPRALWSPHPPLWMLITFIILMTAVWGHYIVIIYELFRLRREEPHQSNAATNS